MMPSGETTFYPIDADGITGIQLKRAIAKRMTDHGVETCEKHFFLSKTSGGLVSDKDMLQAGQEVNANLRASGGCTCECRCNIL